MQLWPLNQDGICSPTDVQDLGRQGERVDSGNALDIDDLAAVKEPAGLTAMSGQDQIAAGEPEHPRSKFSGHLRGISESHEFECSQLQPMQFDAMQTIFADHP